jgi:hypothetical protein
MENIIIRIWATDQGHDEEDENGDCVDCGKPFDDTHEGGGYMFAIHNPDMPDPFEPESSDGLEIDGGLCTGSLSDAVEMASSQARALIERAAK